MELAEALGRKVGRDVFGLERFPADCYDKAANFPDKRAGWVKWATGSNIGETAGKNAKAQWRQLLCFLLSYTHARSAAAYAYSGGPKGFRAEKLSIEKEKWMDTDEEGNPVTTCERKSAPRKSGQPKAHTQEGAKGSFATADDSLSFCDVGGQLRTFSKGRSSAFYPFLFPNKTNQQTYFPQKNTATRRAQTQVSSHSSQSSSHACTTCKTTCESTSRRVRSRASTSRCTAASSCSHSR